MIDRISIHNFQGWDKLSLKLTDPVTMIVGPSDAGKSAIVRAIRWLCQNKPSGDGIRRLGSKSTGVRVRVDGHTIERSKTNDTNTYSLDDREYKAVGKVGDVPEAISRLLGVSDLNFQGQHDAAFWFAESPGAVAKALNGVVSLGAIDDVLGHLGSESKRANMAVELGLERLDKVQAALDDLSWAVEFDKDVYAVEHLGKAWATKWAAVDALRLAVAGVVADRDKAKQLAAMAADGGRLVGLGNRVRTAQAAVDALAADVAAAGQGRPPQPPDLGPLEALATKAKETRRACVALAKGIKEVEQLQTVAALEQVAVADAEQAFAKATKKGCPICGKPMT